MTTFITPLLVFALLVVGHLDCTPPSPESANILRILSQNGRLSRICEGVSSGVENFQYSFLKKNRYTSNIILIPSLGVNDPELQDKELRLDIVSLYLEVLYDNNKIDPKEVLGYKEWCPQQSRKVLEDNPNKIDEDDFNEKRQRQICKEYIRLMGIINELHQTDFQNALKWFYFNILDDLVTPFSIYNNFIHGGSADNVEKHMFYIEKYTVPYYKQYKTLIDNLAKEKNGHFESVEEFCSNEGKKAVIEHVKEYN